MILNSPMLILIVPTCGLEFINLPTSLVTPPPLPLRTFILEMLKPLSYFSISNHKNYTTLVVLYLKKFDINLQ